VGLGGKKKDRTSGWDSKGWTKKKTDESVRTPTKLRELTAIRKKKKNLMPTHQQRGERKAQEKKGKEHHNKLCQICGLSLAGPTKNTPDKKTKTDGSEGSQKKKKFRAV